MRAVCGARWRCSSSFDSASFANQRVKLFEMSNGRPTDIVKELEAIFKGISLGEKSNSIKFMPLDRINTIIAVAPESGNLYRRREVAEQARYSGAGAGRSRGQPGFTA